MSDEGMYLSSGGMPDPNREPWAFEGVAARRLFAFFIDVAIVWGAALFIGIATLGLGLLLFGAVAACVDMILRVAFLSNGSATLGMRMMGIELRTRRGKRLDFLTALLHTALFYVMFAIGLLQAVSVLMMALSLRGHGLHDTILGVTMLKRPE